MDWSILDYLVVNIFLLIKLISELFSKYTEISLSTSFYEHFLHLR